MRNTPGCDQGSKNMRYSLECERGSKNLHNSIEFEQGSKNSLEDECSNRDPEFLQIVKLIGGSKKAPPSITSCLF